MTELQELMRQNVADPPHDDPDFPGLVAAGRRRVRARHGRLSAAAGSAAVAAAAVGAVLVVPHGSHGAAPGKTPEAPQARTLQLSDATPGIEGRDFRVLASHTNGNLDADNGQYFDGVTDDGLILFRDGPYVDRPFPRLALMNPATGAKDWLPDPHLGQQQTVPVELGAHRLVLIGPGGSSDPGPLVAHVFDRDSRQWSRITWPTLPPTSFDAYGVLGPDGRLYVSVPATQGQPPAGGWPMRPGGEADDAGAAGDTYELWSVSLSDPSDVRDEHLRVGSVAFTTTDMVWSDRTNGAAGLLHVRDLATGQEHSFDPQLGARCNLLVLTATSDRIVLSQYCGHLAGGARDDRVQILDTNGDQDVTVQDSGIDGGALGLGGASDVVTIAATEGSATGTYAYDVDSGRFVRVSQGMSMYSMGGPTPANELMWTTPVNHDKGATQWLGELLN